MKQMSKLLAFVLVAAMLLTMTAVTAFAEDIAYGKVDQQSYPLTEEKITLKIWYPHGGSMGQLADFNDGEFWQWLEEKTNVHLEFIVPASGTERESFNLLFAGDELPDIVISQPSVYAYRDGLDAAIEDGYFLDIAENLEWCPNYLSWINNLEYGLKDTYTDTGKIYGLWGLWKNMESGYADQGISIRKDFLDKVGKEIPTTYAEWEDVLLAFKNELGIEAPFYTSKYGIDNGEFMAGYGVAKNFYVVDGQVKYGPMEDGFKEYLEMMNRWYELGILDRDFSTRQSTGIAADNDMILNDKIGALIDWGTRMTDAYVSRGAGNTEFYAVAAPQPKKDAADPDPAWRDATNNFHALNGYCASISAESEYAEIAVRLIDAFYAEDVYWNANYGIDAQEGVVWYKAEDGHRIGDYDFRYSNPDGLDSATVLVKYWAKNPPIRVEAAQIEQMPAERAAAYPVWSQYEPTSFMPTALTSTVEEGSEFSSLYTDIETYVQECNVKFIMGQMSLDDYDAYRDQLVKMGIERCIELKQAALDRYNAR